MAQKSSGQWTRREVVAAGAAVLLGAPAVVTASRTGAKTVVGDGEHQFEIQHDWAQLPDRYSWQTTHNVALDKAGHLYVIHEGHADKKDHPSIFVFDQDGKFVRAFGQQFQGGGHGIEVREEDGEEFLYIAAYKHLKTFAKLTLTGEVIWQRYAPMESGVYAKGEDKNRKNDWGRDRFLPTNFAFLDDGGFLLADGYGSFYIHRYDKDAKWLSCFGGAGKGEGKFATAHGLWIDDRPGREKQIVVTDRAHHTLQYFTMDGKYVETVTGFGLPANVDSWKGLLLVPELAARVSLLDTDLKVVAHLGKPVGTDKNNKPNRADRNTWQDGQFVHPHDACFDPDGNIFVAEWVATGRISRMKRIS